MLKDSDLGKIKVLQIEKYKISSRDSITNKACAKLYIQLILRF